MGNSDRDKEAMRQLTKPIRAMSTIAPTASGVAKVVFPKLSATAKAAERPLTKAYIDGMMKLQGHMMRRAMGASGKIKGGK
jgi:hypothetical protein